MLNQQKYEKVTAAWKKALGPESTGPPFAGDLENPVYLNIL